MDREGRPGTWAVRAFWGLLVLDLAFAAEAARHGALGVTTGATVAGSLLATVALVLALRLLPVPSRVLVRLQVALLAAAALHCVGHVWRLYARVPNYDDVFHVASMFVAGLLVLDLAKTGRFVFPATLGPARVAALVAVTVVALAGAWEMFEWAGDLALGTREQDDLHDTMQDLALGTLGGLFASVRAHQELRVRARVSTRADARPAASARSRSL